MSDEGSSALPAGVTATTIETAIGTLSLQDSSSVVSVSTAITYTFSSTGKITDPVSIITTPSTSQAEATVDTSSSQASTSPSTPTNTSNSTGNSTESSHKTLSAGAISGIAIASAIFGALFVLCLLFFMKSHHKKRRHHGTTSWLGYSDRSSSRRPGQLSSTMRRHPDNVEKGGLIERSVQEITVENALEQPKDDSTIKQSVAALFKAIEDHAVNYYLDSSPQGAPSHQEYQLQYSNLPSGIKDQADVGFRPILAAPETRFSAIASLISATLLDTIDFFGPPEKSLLPEGVTGFLRASSAQVTDSLRSRLYLSRWRTGTAYLLGPEESSQHRARSQMVIDALIADLDAIVGPYVNPETDPDRRQHLVKICKRAQELGLLLLSQPAEWKFDWSNGQQAERTTAQSRRSERPKKPFVVQPQLLRVTDNLARKLDRPLIVIERQVLH
ncbi:uncharacterized protein A1O5_12542 [Cladophialophora psammophila CBS 110553]|uniref:Uncharacterized protein n=1 Tax=Cladophialophora psammophila CBS 110553 TaxID=1182543 RepID=W9VTA7_9EURO|nr:uncharacterized protein A1O5_12542 [Cladophialophora psammophila CBS 110553]EXJ56275.1 hypothetical protein A1O5_12542 [Cladophialophora psammophila CBS 110553]